MEEGTDGGVGFAHDGGDLCGGEVFYGGEQKNLTLEFGEAIDGVEDEAALFGVVEGLVMGSAGRDESLKEEIVGLIGLVSTAAVQGEVPGDADKPGAEVADGRRGATVCFLLELEHADKGVLNGVFGFGAVAEEAMGDAKQGSRVGVDERGEIHLGGRGGGGARKGQNEFLEHVDGAFYRDRRARMPSALENLHCMDRPACGAADDRVNKYAARTPRHAPPSGKRPVSLRRHATRGIAPCDREKSFPMHEPFVSVRSRTIHNVALAYFESGRRVSDSVRDLCTAGFEAEDINVSQTTAQGRQTPGAEGSSLGPKDLGAHSLRWLLHRFRAHDQHRRGADQMHGRNPTPSVPGDSMYATFDLHTALYAMHVPVEVIALLQQDMRDKGMFLLVDAHERVREAEGILTRNAGYIRTEYLRVSTR